jgi:hypothetical protein
MHIEVMSRKGHEVLAEWHPQTPAAELRAIGTQFAAWRRKGYRAFGVVSGQPVDRFDPQLVEDLVFIAPVVGG